MSIAARSPTCSGAVLTGLARMSAAAGDPQRYTAAVDVFDRFIDGSLVTTRS